MTTAECDAQALGFARNGWAGRRVLVVGLGRSGQAAARLLVRQGCCVRITDARQTNELNAMRDALTALGVERVELGGHTPAILDGVEQVVVSPGVPETAGPVGWALTQGIPVLSEVDLAFQCCPCPVIAVTGTNGKSTAVTLIAELLRAGGRSAIACGNVGIPFASVIDRLTPQSIAVVELSSFQLLWCHAFRPHIGVFLNIDTNHLDRHRDQEAYLGAKARLFTHQRADDWAVLNGNEPRIAALGERGVARRVWFGHNRSNTPAFHLAPETQRMLSENGQAVLQVARVMGIPDPFTWQMLRAFPGLEHRLEPAGTIRGVRFINDSKSTTPSSLRYALAQTPGEVVVIMGGRDKGLDFHSLVPPLHDARVKGIVLIGESRVRLHEMLNGTTQPSDIHEARTLEDAVTRAATLAPPGSTVLFSPACASFDMFRDFEDRGRAFKSLVQHIASAETRGQAFSISEMENACPLQHVE